MSSTTDRGDAGDQGRSRLKAEGLALLAKIRRADGDMADAARLHEIQLELARPQPTAAAPAGPAAGQ